MDNILWKIQDTVNKYVVVLSEILKVDVVIADSNLIRIAGTGQYKEKNNLNMLDEGHIAKMVIDTGMKKIIENPRENEVCANCPDRLNCIETFDMNAPIKLNEKVIGIIAFVCTTEAQKKHILENYNTFINFIDQISDLIVSKALEAEENERNLALIGFLNEIIDNTEEGIIVLDGNSNISRANEAGKKILGINLNNNKNINVQLKSTGDMLMGLMEYEVQIENRFVDTIGKMYRINNNDYNELFIFKDPEAVQQKALSVTTTKEKFNLSNILGESKEIQVLNQKIKRLASSASTVLITGESGTGKELYARALHNESERSEEPFIAVNCAAIPENLLESELFGYVKGAFTGADPKGKIGKFEQANNGTIFLDEIGDMPIYIQVKLLRVLEQREVIRLGSNKTININARVIAATNKDLEDMVKNNTFREDLYYRLNVIPIFLPPLRKRNGDIKLLTHCFIHKFSKLFNKNVSAISQSFWSFIEKYNWPGNVRELQNTIEYVINMMGEDGNIDEDLLPAKIKNSTKALSFNNYAIECMEKELFKKAIELYGSNGESKKVIAEKMGIGIATLYRKLKKYNIKL
ncbi:sigma 54-interacting transcriptional regulator [Clostridium sp. PL3]|uniref:Sigma 54-interacting transcriptional regulator n=1 Tax=Clostridium thailandense TaxID=2794346 RepID=A0A949WXT7_9CLOT|nr:sigma 54-interacting transcriptional regulator [Clostridium thailandense]MBV7276337.1 sigma 54-interacting transcriptional regulator [Clostridium thailandense]